MSSLEVRMKELTGGTAVDASKLAATPEAGPPSVAERAPTTGAIEENLPRVSMG